MSKKEKRFQRPVEDIEKFIYHTRGQRVMLDSDLAKIYGVTTKRLNEQVKRNRVRFPDDFVFQLTREEVNRPQLVTGSGKNLNLRSQIATSSSYGGRRHLP